MVPDALILYGPFLAVVAAMCLGWIAVHVAETNAAAGRAWAARLGPVCRWLEESDR